jgi:cytochrome c oxidase accessory protein FixG
LDYKAQALGDCLDCTLCVQACPTGIDIRNGLQYECIACAACIDACDSVMDKMNYPRNLVRYSTQAVIDGDATRVLRPRTVIYGSLLLVLLAGFFYSVTHRSLLQVDVLKDRNAMYRELDDGRIENVYTVRIINKDARPHAFTLKAQDLPNVEIDAEQAQVEVQGGEVATMALRLRILPVSLESERSGRRGAHDIRIAVTAVDDQTLRAETPSRFFVPE